MQRHQVQGHGAVSSLDVPPKTFCKHYKVFGQIQCRKSVAKDPKMVAIVLSLQFFWLKVVALVTVAIA
jgi:hypothetical protein